MALIQRKNSWRILTFSSMILLFVSLLITLSAINRFIRKKDSRSVPVLTKSDIQTQKNFDIVIPKAKPFSAYADIISQRDIFKLPYEQFDLTSRQETDLPQADDSDWIRNYKVSGILVDGDPRCVIEDVAANEIIFLAVGDHLKEAVVEKIEKGRVTFLYNNRRIELTP
ncbi:MAG: hypothetical protein KBD53_08885 [Candidatus Omnitrophica bacterium]|nr:hypothetical protein [Candidatus Omnitrophota bacterium]